MSEFEILPAVRRPDRSRTRRSAGLRRDLLYDQLKNAPWVGLSILAHGVVFGILAHAHAEGTDLEQREAGRASSSMKPRRADIEPELEEDVRAGDRGRRSPSRRWTEVDRGPGGQGCEAVSDHNETDNDHGRPRSRWVTRASTRTRPFEGPGTNGVDRHRRRRGRRVRRPARRPPQPACGRRRQEDRRPRWTSPSSG